MNSDYFVLLGSFTIEYCKYFTEKFLSSLSPELLCKLFRYMNENNNCFLWTDREEKICLGFQEAVIEVTNSGIHSFLIRSVETI